MNWYRNIKLSGKRLLKQWPENWAEVSKWLKKRYGQR